MRGYAPENWANWIMSLIEHQAQQGGWKSLKNTSYNVTSYGAPRMMSDVSEVKGEGTQIDEIHCHVTEAPYWGEFTRDSERIRYDSHAMEMLVQSLAHSIAKTLKERLEVQDH
jgi:hypothetical protein